MSSSSTAITDVRILGYGLAVMGTKPEVALALQRIQILTTIRATDDFTIRGYGDTPMYTLVASINKDLAGLIVVDSGCSWQAFNDRNAFIIFRAHKLSKVGFEHR